MLKNTLLAASLLLGAMSSVSAQAENYVIDTKGGHASINFAIKHLGYSWLTGRFDKFSGNFVFDAKNPAASKVTVDIDTTSLNSNHALRDKHLRSGDYLNVSKFPKARFESTSIELLTDTSAIIHGKMTLNGVTRDMDIDASYVGGGDDPWGGFRQGFSGKTKIVLKDYGYSFNLGPASQEVALELHVEGIRQ